VGPAGDGKASCRPLSIATASALTGSDAALGNNVKFGAQLAVDQHNAANPDCQVTLKPFDTESDPQKTSEIAPQMVDDASIVGLVGPTFSGETKASGTIFDQAGLVAATPGATNVTLSQYGWKTFFRGLANDGVQGPSIANYLKNSVGAKKACVLDDSGDYGLGIADAVRQTLGSIADANCNIQVKKGNEDFAAAVTQIKAESPDSIFYGGYYTEAAILLQQLRDAGVTATFAVGDGSKDPELVKQAGSASKDALMGCPCAPASGPFADAYTKKYGQDPGTYSTEAYDLTTMMLKGIDSGAITRAAMLDFVRHYNGQGVARKYQWGSDGELTTTLIWMYKVQ
jgi:branched-chain amino acid transport system substrate-binding protein